jgi:O-antigen/teichoic acid export membrane protein
MLLPQLIQQLRRIQVDLSFHSWKQYLLDVRPIIFSSFFANASASVPVIVLGALGSAIQTGLYTASDRLTRAAAYLISFIEQALMVYIAKLNHTNSDSLSLIRMRILIAIAIIMSIVCTISIGLSGWFLNLLYGSAFYAGIPILQILIVWLFLYAIRKAGTTFFFIAIGKLATISYLQWAEAISVLFFCALGGYLYSAKGVAIALCGVEILLLILIIYKSRNKQIKDQL